MEDNTTENEELKITIGDKQIVPEFLDIVLYPDERLNTACTPVEESEFGTEELYQEAANMYASMIKHGGVGIAANQVGIMKQIAIVKSVDHTFIMINPILFQKEGKQKFEEGCLSFPGIFQVINRFEKIKIVYRDVDGEHKELTVNGDLAVAIQHEFDHLDGKTMLDNLSMLKRAKLKKKIKKMDWYES